MRFTAIWRSAADVLVKHRSSYEWAILTIARHRARRLVSETKDPPHSLAAEELRIAVATKWSYLRVSALVWERVPNWIRRRTPAARRIDRCRKTTTTK